MNRRESQRNRAFKNTYFVSYIALPSRPLSRTDGMLPPTARYLWYRTPLLSFNHHIAYICWSGVATFNLAGRQYITGILLLLEVCCGTGTVRDVCSAPYFYESVQQSRRSRATAVFRLARARGTFQKKNIYVSIYLVLCSSRRGLVTRSQDKLQLFWSEWWKKKEKKTTNCQSTVVV